MWFNAKNFSSLLLFFFFIQDTDSVKLGKSTSLSEQNIINLKYTYEENKQLYTITGILWRGQIYFNGQKYILVYSWIA